jgi:hypothetical protein
MQSLLDATQPKGRRYYWKSEYLPRVELGLIDAAVDHLSHIPSAHSAFMLFHVEGALGERPLDHSPMGNRDAAFVCTVMSSWERANDDAVNLDWTRAFWQAVRPFSTGGVYLNFLTADEGADRVAAAYGKTTLDRLAANKRTYDPNSLFRHTKSVSR